MKKYIIAVALFLGMVVSIPHVSAEDCERACAYWDSYLNKFSTKDDCINYFCYMGQLKSNCHPASTYEYTDENGNLMQLLPTGYLYVCDENTETSNNNTTDNATTDSKSEWCESASTDKLKKECNKCIKKCNTGNETADNECLKGCENNAGVSHASTNIEEMQTYQGKYIQCGDSGAIPNALPKLSRLLVLAVQIFVPIVLIIFGMIDFMKAVASSDSDFLDKAKKKFIRRLISAVAVFFVLSIVKVAVSNFAGDSGALECVDCFISKGSSCKAATYKRYGE